MSRETMPPVMDVRVQVEATESSVRPRRIALALLLCLALWFYYSSIDGAFRRPSTAAFAPPTFLATEVARTTGASWQAVSVKSGDLWKRQVMIGNRSYSTNYCCGSP